jgi:hypothetical protein
VIGAAQWEAITELLENAELARIANERLTDGQRPVRVTLDEL